MYHCWSTESSSWPASASTSCCYEVSNEDRRHCSSSQAQVHQAAMPLRRGGGGGGGGLEEEDDSPRAPAGRYSAEERRERIDKYRSKRNQRNFDKKITYACRKTLADSRPRVKGRFARNSDSDSAAAAAAAAAEEAQLLTEADEVPPPTNAISIPSNANNAPEWWPAVQEALARQEQEADLHLCDTADDELLAAYLGVSSIDLYSPRGH